MDYWKIFLLLSVGFLVGLSGAIMPGPLLVYTINESLKKGKWVGALVIIGHAIVEVGVFILLAFGLMEYLATDIAVKATGLVGGVALILMSLHSLRDLGPKTHILIKKSAAGKTKYGIVASGIMFTAFNPGFPIWWATAGTSLLVTGFKELGTMGMVIVLIGHWGADLGWFLLVSLTAEKSASYLFGKGWYRNVRLMLSTMLLLVGVYFLSTAL